MMPLADAARELGVAPVTLKRWRKLGCPCVPGRRGRGHAALYDPDAIRTWRAAHGREAAMLEIAAAAPGVLADATLDAFNQIDAPDKRRQAGLLAGTWYVLTTALLDHLRTTCAEVPELAGVPGPVERLRKIAAA
ncbi:MerR family transcriptional regulator [Xenophilus sp. Marseille-Q4582]|uniref:MerR family transcriptional regulator n=1 Tax=Xenophilus sp. Marseille-Q4582 TaxID=2866600 RepID=UPI001CE3C012|nr:MerR family transcriptional regulator [Xenophilus sp. Marseille-Q4582]